MRLFPIVPAVLSLFVSSLAFAQAWDIYTNRENFFTLNLPDEDRYLRTRDELVDHMTMLLGGRVAEELVFGAVTTGASDDLDRVAEISRSMVHEYAMGTTITSRKVSAEGGAVSDRTRQLRDDEQQHLADEAHRAAQRLIVEHRAQLEEFARELLRNEVLDREDINRIMAGARPSERRHGLRVVAASDEATGSAPPPH